MENRTAILDADMETQNSKMSSGLQRAIDDSFSGSHDPKELVKTLQSAGFSNDWPLRERECAVARLAIKHKFRMWQEQRVNVQPILDVLIAAYRSVMGDHPKI